MATSVLTLASALLALLGLAWWRGLRPSNDRDWRADVARLATAEVRGDHVTLTNVRNFSYRAIDEFDERWEKRSFDLTALEGLDLFFVDWGAPLINHRSSAGRSSAPRPRPRG